MRRVWGIAVRGLCGRPVRRRGRAGSPAAHSACRLSRTDNVNSAPAPLERPGAWLREIQAPGARAAYPRLGVGLACRWLSFGASNRMEEPIMSNPTDAVFEDTVFDVLVLAAIERAAPHRPGAHAGVPVWGSRAH